MRRLSARSGVSALAAALCLLGCRTANPAAPARSASPSPASGASSEAARPPAAQQQQQQAPPQQRPAAGPRPFREVIPASANADSGMFVVYRTADDKFFFQIPDSLLGREMFMIS